MTPALLLFLCLIFLPGVLVAQSLAVHHQYLPSLHLASHDLQSSTYIFTVFRGGGVGESIQHNCTFSFPVAPTKVQLNSVPLQSHTTGSSPLLPLHAGHNTVEVTVPSTTHEVTPPTLTVTGSLLTSPPTFGANLPYTEVEAEGPTVTTTGTLMGPSYTFTTLAAEASGRKAISLAPGQSMDLPAPTTTNALTIRYSIPDSATGGGLDTPLILFVDMGFVQNVTLTSNFSYFYGAYPFTKNPSDGLPHHYFNEVDVMLPSTVAQGAIIRLLNPDVVSVVGGGDECGVVPHNPLRDCGFNGINSSQCLDRQCCWKPVTPNPNHIPYCYYPQPPPPPPPQPGNLTITIDLLDFWLIPDPLPQPPNSISVLDHGADPSGTKDSTSSFMAALASAAATHAPLWVPQGTFTVTQPLQLTSNLTLLGAGSWHSRLQGGGVGLVGGKGGSSSGSSKRSSSSSRQQEGAVVSGVRVSGLGIMGNTRIRDDSAQDAGVFGALSNSVLSDLTISHTKCGMWLTGPFDSLLISGVRIHDTTADGINLCSGVTHTRVEHCIIRNTGDDGLAMWSANGRADTNNTFAFNTVAVPVLANGVAIYGGSDNAAVGNAVADVLTAGGGVHVGNRFTAVPLGGHTLLQGNSIVRCGCLDPNWQFGVGALWFYALDEALTGEVTCTGNTLVDSPYEAYQFLGSGSSSSKGVSGVRLVNESVVNVGSFVLQVQAEGGAFVQGLVASGTQKAGVYNCSSGFALVDGGGNAGFATQVCGFYTV